MKALPRDIFPAAEILNCLPALIRWPGLLQAVPTTLPLAGEAKAASPDLPYTLLLQHLFYEKIVPI